MDPSSFDCLSRLLATTSGRRGAVALLTGAFTGLFSGLGPAADPAAAQARRCPKSKRLCRGRCLPKRRCCRNRDCPANQLCRRGRCRCGPGKRRCGQRCIARAACCRHAQCGAGGVCLSGRCLCLSGFKPCLGRCIAQATCCGGCPARQRCSGGACVPSCGTPGVPCRVFVTSTLYRGDLREGGQGSGIEGADAKCQAHAATAGLTGTYKAWISGSTLASSPAQRFTNTASTGPYVLVNGTQIAATWADLTDGTLQAEFNVTELRDPVGFRVWTHTLANGTQGGQNNVHCQEWTSAAASDAGDFGATSITNAGWTVIGTSDCESGTHPLFCFEQG